MIPTDLEENTKKPKVSQQKEHSLSVTKHGTKLCSIPGMGILPGKRMKWTLSGGDTLHRAWLGMVHIPDVILIHSWTKWGSEMLNHLSECPSAEVKCLLDWFTSHFALKSVPLRTRTHMVLCTQYLAQNGVLSPCMWQDSLIPGGQQREGPTAAVNCAAFLCTGLLSITWKMRSVTSPHSIISASDIYEIIRSWLGWKPSQKPTISLSFLLVITESFQFLLKITDLKISTTCILLNSWSAVSEIEKKRKKHRPLGFKETNGSTYLCVSMGEGGKKRGVEGEMIDFLTGTHSILKFQKFTK